MNFWHAVEHPTEGRLRVPSFPVRDGGPKADATPAGVAPRLGEHTVEVLRGAGIDEPQIESLLAAGAIAAAEPN